MKHVPLLMQKCGVMRRSYVFFIRKPCGNTFFSPFIICQATIIKLKLLVNDWRYISTSSISIPASSEIILLKPKVFVFIDSFTNTKHFPTPKKQVEILPSAISYEVFFLSRTPGLVCQAAGHAPSKGHRRDKRAPSAAVPVTFFPAWMKRPVFFQGKV